mmetsp:Transcript_31428/g.81835  ORF Transcript_31428/g.81835 Transcript_31428/m.81835 type:complete len:212 (+) Transcript_31428:472-1107(+)
MTVAMTATTETPCPPAATAATIHATRTTGAMTATQATGGVHMTALILIVTRMPAAHMEDTLRTPMTAWTPMPTAAMMTGALEAPTAAPTLLPGLPPMTAHPVGDLLGSAACCGQHHHLLEVICWAAPHVEPFDKLLSSTPRAKSGTGGCPTPTLTLQPRRCCPSLYSPPLISLSPHPLAAPLCRASIQLERNSSDCSSGSSSSSSSNPKAI